MILNNLFFFLESKMPGILLEVEFLYFEHLKKQNDKKVFFDKQLNLLFPRFYVFFNKFQILLKKIFNYCFLFINIFFFF